MASSHQRITILLAILLPGPGCKTEDPFFCPGAPYNNCIYEAGVPIPCISECSGDTPVCAPSLGACVQCTPAEHEECSGSTPVCRDNTCQRCMPGECDSGICLPDGSCGRCTTHEECDSGACLPDGSCGSDTNVAYVDPAGTDNSMCTRAMPCTRVSTALATARPYVKLTGKTSEPVIVGNGRVVAFLADPGAELTRMTEGAIVTVRDTGTSLTIYDLSIREAPGSNSIGVLVPDAAGDPTVTLTRARVVNNQGRGISTSGGMLTVTRSTISGNARGGITIFGGQFDLTNNFITGNGTTGTTGTYGGVRFDSTITGTRRFEFNTVTGNKSRGNVASGVACTSVTGPVTFSNNIVYGNERMDGRTQVSKTGSDSACSWTYSIIGPEPPDGMGNSDNINMDPGLVDPTHGDLHLGAGSPARNAADRNATLAIDFDGQARPQGMGRDIGADEVP